MIRPAVAAITLEHDHAEYFDRGDVIAVGRDFGRVLYVDVPHESVTVDFFGVVRRLWWGLWHR